MASFFGCSPRCELKLSVVVPAYNVADYIECCIESILNQSYKNLEVIVVNDGSTDRTREKIRKYEADPRLMVVTQPNRGLSAARNTGIQMATGELITFVDSDDRVHEDSYADNILYFASDPAIDFVQFPVMMEWEGDNQRIFRPMASVLSNSEDIFAAWWKNDRLIYSAWSKIYKRELFDQTKFPEKKVYEDIFVVVPLCRQIRKVVISEKGLYYYRFRPDSILNSKSDLPGKNLNQLEATLSLYRHALNFQNLKQERAAFFLRLCQWQFYTLCAFSAEEQAKLLQTMRHQTALWSDIFCAHLSARQKMMLSAIKLLGFNVTNLIYLFFTSMKTYNPM